MKPANKKESDHMGRVSMTDCVICREWHDVRTPAEIHHIADGSNPRSHYLTVALCYDHHRGKAYGLHGAGVKQFCRLYQLPNEYYLLELQNKFLAEDRNG